MFLHKYQHIITRDPDVAIDRARDHTPDVHAIQIRPTKSWLHKLNHVKIGSIDVIAMYGTSAAFKVKETDGIVLSARAAGVQEVSFAGEKRRLSDIATFWPHGDAECRLDHCELYSCSLDPERLQAALTSLECDVDLKTFLRRHWRQELPGLAAVSNAMLSMLHQIDSPAGLDAATAAMFQDLIHVLSAKVIAHQSDASGTKIATRGGFQRCVDYVDATLPGPVVLTDLAAAVGLSLRTIQLTFRRETGMSLTQFILNRRLTRARQLLKSPSEAKTVTKIAFEVGFNNLSYFTRSYNEAFGESPRMTMAGHSPRRK